MEKASYMKHIHDFKVKVGEDLAAAGFSWPPRSYVCTFCKREFRSAQALGGHMNVHRRDRARLRQSPVRDVVVRTNGTAHFSLLNLNLEPNPSFFPSSPPPLSSSSSPLVTTKLLQFASKFGGDVNAVPVEHGRPVVTADLMKLRASKGARKSTLEFVSLELEMGLISRPSKEEIDLELRLGCNY